MTRVYAIRHVGFEDLGLLGPLLAMRGADITYADAWAVDTPAARHADLLVILGGPISANDGDAYPFIETEIALARERLQAHRPLLGICLGAQIVCRALGGTVAPGSAPEIGWGKLDLTDAGRAGPLRHLQGVPVLHWHGEVCALPPGVPSLAATPLCANQAFQPHRHALALQFHAEAGARDIEPWLVGHCAEIAHTPGVSVEALRTATARNGARLAAAGRAMFAEWLDAADL